MATMPQRARKSNKLRANAGNATKACKIPPTPRDAAPMANGPTFAANVAAVPVVPQRMAATSPVPIPHIRLLFTGPPAGKSPCCAPETAPLYYVPAQLGSSLHLVAALTGRLTGQGWHSQRIQVSR